MMQHSREKKTHNLSLIFDLWQKNTRKSWINVLAEYTFVKRKNSHRFCKPGMLNSFGKKYHTQEHL